MSFPTAGSHSFLPRKPYSTCAQDIMRVEPQPRVWAPWGIFIQASPVVDLAIVVCDTYW